MRGLSVLSLGCFLALVPVVGAQAGFDWVPPVGGTTVSSEPAPDMKVEPVSPVMREPIEPTVAASMTSAPQDIAVVPEAPTDESVDAPAAPAPSYPAREKQSRAPAHQTAEATKTRAVYPPRGNLAAAPLKGNHVAGNVPVPTRQAPADPVVTVKSDAPTPRPVEDDTPTLALAPQQKSMAPLETARTYDLPRLDGFGESIPFSVAIAQIVPSDFTVTYEDQPDPDTLVSWAGGRPWDRVLEDMLYAHGYRVMVGHQTVSIFKAGRAPSVTTKNLAPGHAAWERPIVEPMMRPEGPGAVGVAVPAPTMNDVTASSEPKGYQAGRVDIFSARAGESARAVLERWATQAQVTLYWDADDRFVLREPVAFNATFARAVEQVLGVFRGQPGRPIAELHPNAPMGPVVLNVRAASDQSLTVK